MPDGRENRAATPRRNLWLLLHGADAAAPSRGCPPARVVLLHGWLQTHSCWLETATALRDNFGHDVLLLDFVPDTMGIEGWMAQLRERIAAIGWDEGLPLSIAGCSLGAAVASRYAAASPERVARLTMVAPPGLPEPWYMPCHPVRNFAKLVCAAAPEAKCVANLHVIHQTPEYGMPLDTLFANVESGTLRLAVYVAEMDIIHRPRIEFWRKAEARAAKVGKPGGSLRVTMLPGRTHWGVCTGLFELGLQHEEALWHPSTELTRDQREPLAAPELVGTTNSAPRSRL